MMESTNSNQPAPPMSSSLPGASISTTATTTQTPTQPTATVKKKFPLKYIVASAVLALLIVGVGAGYWLTQQSQDIRQQAAIYSCSSNADCAAGEVCDLISGNCVAESQGCNNDGRCDATESYATCPEDCPTAPAGGTCQNPAGCNVWIRI